MAENRLSKRKKTKFSHDGHLYVYDKCSKSDLSLLLWKCELKNECKGRVHTKNNELVKKVNEHCYGASAVDVEVACIKTSLKRKSKETLEVSSTIINGCIENSSQAVEGSLPNSHTLKKSYEESATWLSAFLPTLKIKRNWWFRTITDAMWQSLVKVKFFKLVTVDKKTREYYTFIHCLLWPAFLCPTFITQTSLHDRNY